MFLINELSQLVFELKQTPQVLLTHCVFLAGFNSGKSFFSYQIDEQTMNSDCERELEVADTVQQSSS